jgi:hypothetical protein
MVFDTPSAIKEITPFLVPPEFAAKITLRVPLLFPEVETGINHDTSEATFQKRLEDIVAAKDPPVAGKFVEVGETTN